MLGYAQGVLSLKCKFPYVFAYFFATTIFPGIHKQVNTTVSTVAPKDTNSIFSDHLHNDFGIFAGF